MRRANIIIWQLALCTLPLGVFAQPVSPPLAAADPAHVRREAAERFDRGLALFNEGDNAGALSEFRRAYELAPEPVVLFNIGLTYAALHRPVEAADALQAVLSNPAGLTDGQRGLAGRTALDQQRRIGFVDVSCNVDANVAVDGVELAKTPFAAPLRIAQGTHILAAAASDHLTRNLEITVAGGEYQRVELHLPTNLDAASQLTIVSPLPAMNVRVDNVSVGKTPLQSSIRVEPGVHTISGEREGYVREVRELTLARGGLARLELTLPEDPHAPEALRGRLELHLNEAADVYLDGSARGQYTAPLRLVRGPHLLRVERSGFEPYEREIEINAGQDTSLRVPLRPSAATRASFEAAAHAQHVRAWVTLSAGALVLAAGASLAAISQLQHGEAVNEYNQLAQSHLRGSERECDPQQDKDVLNANRCGERLQQAEASVQAHDTWRTVGVIASGVGAVALVTGVVLLLAADRTDRYKELAARKHALRGYAASGRVGLTLSARF